MLFWINVYRSVFLAMQNHLQSETRPNIVPIIQSYGLCDYVRMHENMKAFMAKRDAVTRDELWFLQHQPVFTLGRNESRKNILIDSDIPVIQSDRGGDVTYHGPGQLIIYCLLDLKRLQLGIKDLVAGLEEIVIQYLDQFGVSAHRLQNAPGVYVENKKLASLGMRVRNGYTFHGMAINVDMDLQPFANIHPCGLQNMQVTQLCELGIQTSCEKMVPVMHKLILKQFYKTIL